MPMLNQSRDKIALVVFFCLILLGLGVLIGYIHLGHSWNVAASNIDDAAGSMEGYTTILYEGTVPEGAAKASSEDNLLQEEPSSKESADVEDGTSAYGALSGVSPETSRLTDEDTTEGEVSDEDSSQGDVGALGITASEGELEERASSDEYLDVPGEDSLNDLDQDNTADEGVGAPRDTIPSKKTPVLDIAEVEESYRDKQATVFTLDTEDLSKYYDGLILKKGNHRFGVFSLVETDTPFKIERQISYFKKHEVDFIVVITPDIELVEMVSDVDIVVSTQNENLFVMGETIRDTFYVATPTVGSVGAIIISPSNVVSAKVLSAS